MVSYKRSLIKSITWRIIGTVDTFIIAWLLTGDLSLGLVFGLAETISGLGLYFVHERVWDKISYGRIEKRKMLKSTNIAKH